MDLGQTGRSQGFHFQINDLHPPVPQLLLQQVLHQLKGKGRHPILEMAELLHHLWRQHIGPSRQQLTQLDEG